MEVLALLQVHWFIGSGGKSRIEEMLLMMQLCKGRVTSCRHMEEVRVSRNKHLHQAGAQHSSSRVDMRALDKVSSSQSFDMVSQLYTRISIRF